MKIEYDEEVDAAYIYLKYPIKDGESKKTKQLNQNIIIDLDAKGKLLGVEILDASRILNKKLILEAKQIPA